MAEEWRERNRPARLERRYEFGSYDELRDFLDKAASLSDEKNLYPNIGFGRGYVNFTIYPDEGHEDIGETERDFASQLEKISNCGTVIQA